jgi:hypothetical protein
VSGREPRLVWYWYDVDGHAEVSPARAKLGELRAVLSRGRAAQRVVVLSTAAVTTEEARDRLGGFLSAHAGQLVLQR